jgi:hypothetical protein
VGIRQVVAAAGFAGVGFWLRHPFENAGFAGAFLAPFLSPLKPGPGLNGPPSVNNIDNISTTPPLFSWGGSAYRFEIVGVRGNVYSFDNIGLAGINLILRWLGPSISFETT